jgi:cell wall assembly regulator SMI1
MPTDAILVAWRKIEWTLYQIDPSYANQLPSGVSDSEIVEAERVLGVCFPQAVKAYFQIHNGFGRRNCKLQFAIELDGPGGGIWTLFTLAEAIDYWKELVGSGKT